MHAGEPGATSPVAECSRARLPRAQPPSRTHAKRGDVPDVFSSRRLVRRHGHACTSISPTMCSTISPSTGSVLPLTKAFPVRGICLVFRTWFHLTRMLIGSDHFRHCIRQRACLGRRNAQYHLVGAPRQPCSVASPSALEQRT